MNYKQIDMVQALYARFGEGSWVWTWLMPAPPVVCEHSAYREFIVKSTGKFPILRGENCVKYPLKAGREIVTFPFREIHDSGIPGFPSRTFQHLADSASPFLQKVRFRSVLVWITGFPSCPVFPCRDLVIRTLPS